MKQDPQERGAPATGAGDEIKYEVVTRYRNRPLPTAMERMEMDRVARKMLNGTADDAEIDRFFPGMRATLENARRLTDPVHRLSEVLKRSPEPMRRPDPGVSAHVRHAEELAALREEIAALRSELHEATRPEPFADAVAGDVLHDDAPLVEVVLGTGKKPS